MSSARVRVLERFGARSPQADKLMDTTPDINIARGGAAMPHVLRNGSAAPHEGIGDKHVLGHNVKNTDMVEGDR
jgi:hypothetical protein